MALIFTDIIAQNGYIGQYICFVYFFLLCIMLNSTWVVIHVPRASGPLDYISQYIQIATHVHRRKIVHKTDILANISILCYNISEYQGQRTLVFYFYPMYSEKYILASILEKIKKTSNKTFGRRIL